MILGVTGSHDTESDIGIRYVRHLETDDVPLPTKRKRLVCQMELRRISPEPMSFLGFFRFLYMLKYPPVALLALAWCLGVAMPDIGISNIVPLAFGSVYGWDSSAQGLSNAGFLIGCIIGEVFAGSVSDWVSRSPGRLQSLAMLTSW